MFGKGIYFADCPQKSCKYANHIVGRGKLLLLNRVEMGQPKFMKRANNREVGYRSASGPRLLTEDGLCSRPSDAYDSVVAVTTDKGGVVRVPEYVIYNPRQAI